MSGLQTEELIKIVGAVAPSVGKYLSEKLAGKKNVSVPEMNAFLLAKLLENDEMKMDFNKRLMNVLENQEIILKNHIGHEESVLRELEGCMRSVKLSLELLNKRD